MSALFNFHSFLTVVLLGICACTYVKIQFPALLEQRTGSGCKKEIFLEKELVEREYVHWQVSMAQNNITSSTNQNTTHTATNHKRVYHESNSLETTHNTSQESRTETVTRLSPAPPGQKIPLYTVAHSRAGDKGNDLNFSVIPHYPPDLDRLKMVITPEWVKKILSPLLNVSPFHDSDGVGKRDEWVEEHVKVEIYEVRGICSMNVVVRDILDGGVNCSRRIDRHGKTISDVVLCQQVVLPP